MRFRWTIDSTWIVRQATAGAAGNDRFHTREEADHFPPDFMAASSVPPLKLVMSS
jgi:hypothetical protein